MSIFDLLVTQILESKSTTDVHILLEHVSSHCPHLMISVLPHWRGNEVEFCFVNESLFLQYVYSNKQCCYVWVKNLLPSSKINTESFDLFLKIFPSLYFSVQILQNAFPFDQQPLLVFLDDSGTFSSENLFLLSKANILFPGYP